MNIDGFPTAVTQCRVCGEDIIYFVYQDSPDNTVRRRRPKRHNGMCTNSPHWVKKSKEARLKLEQKLNEFVKRGK
jgi:hypothetical protein